MESAIVPVIYPNIMAADALVYQSWYWLGKLEMFLASMAVNISIEEWHKIHIYVSHKKACQGLRGFLSLQIRGGQPFDQETDLQGL